MKRSIGTAWLVLALAGCGGANDAGPSSETPTGGPTTGGAGTADTTGASDGPGTGGNAGAASSTAGTAGSAVSTGNAGAGGAGSVSDDAGDAGASDSGASDAPVGDAGPIPGPGPAGMSSFDWGKAVIDTEIAGKTSLGTSYPEGLILHGIYKAYKRLRDPRYLSILTTSADGYGVASGGSLDSIMHMTALVDAYE